MRILLLIVLASLGLQAQKHPCLALTKEGIKEIKTSLGSSALFDASFQEAKAKVDKAILNGFEVPVPKEMAGGHSHEVHKNNYATMEAAGYLFQITGDEKYAYYLKDIFYKYAQLYKGLGLHPANKSYAPGKLFWQCLNDANWLVASSQAYDCVYTWLSKQDRTYLEENLFVPYADFLSIETPQFFNRIHNHSTWGAAGVGMIGLVMDNQTLVDRALYGSSKEAKKIEGKFDNDGGLLNSEKEGFLEQIKGLFSSDGLYSEGAYYHRYSIYPFLIFATSLHNTKPELNIFAYQDSLLIKSVYALLNQTTSTGDFYPLNDAQKGMSVYNSSLISAVDIAYTYGSQDPSLLSIADMQGKVSLNNSGIRVSNDISKKIPLPNKSVIYKDGIDGNGGTLGIIRTPNDINLIAKAGTHGMGHGHFDQLNYTLYYKGHEVIQDYGMARFVNIEQKAGGGYLPENTSFAKQTIGHSTLVVDQTTQYAGNTQEADLHSPTLNFSDFSNSEVQIISSKDSSAYNGVTQNRTLVLINSKDFANPFLIDLFEVNADKSHSLDLPLYYLGQLIGLPKETTIEKAFSALGASDGYQHIFKEATANVKKGTNQVSFLNNRIFYTYTMQSQDEDNLLFARVGANDPNFNLRRDPLLIQRRQAANTTFLSALEIHGSYSPVTEKAINSYSDIEELSVEDSPQNYSIIKITTKENNTWLLCLSKTNTKNNSINYNGKEITWKGYYSLTKI